MDDSTQAGAMDVAVDIATWIGQHADVMAAALLVVTAASTAFAGMVVLARRRGAVSAAARAIWLEITPPPSSALDATDRAGWQVILGALHRTHRSWTSPWTSRRCVSAEFWADDAGVHAGIWVPPVIAADRLAGQLQRAWPGSRVSPARGPDWPRRAGAAIELRPRHGAWAPIIDPTPRATLRPASASVRPARDVVDPLRGVLDALAHRAPGELGGVQLIVTPHHRRGTRALATAALTAAADVVTGGVRELIEILLPGRQPRRRTASTPTTGTTPVDPVRAATTAAVTAKRVAGPHLLVTLRAAVATPAQHPTRHRDRSPTRTSSSTRGGWRGRARHGSVARRLAGDIAGGYDLATLPATLRGRWRRHPAHALAVRAPGCGFIATLPELAALWHLPAEPARYGMPAPRARTRPPGWDLPRTAAPRHRGPEVWT